MECYFRLKCGQEFKCEAGTLKSDELGLGYIKKGYISRGQYALNLEWIEAFDIEFKIDQISAKWIQ